MLCSAATKDCRLIHGINPGNKKTIFGNQFSMFDSPRDFPQRISSDNVQRNREAVPLDHQAKVKASLTNLWHNSNADVCVKTFDYEFCNTGGITAELRGRTAKTANVGIAIRQIP